MGVYIKGITIDWLNTATQEEIADMLNRTDEMVEKSLVDDEPYIDLETGILHWCGWKYKRIEDEPQTDCAWGKV